MTEKRASKFIINKFLTIKLEGKKSNIYVKNKRFRQCKFLLIDIPINDISSFDAIESIDAAAERLDHSLEPRHNRNYLVFEIPPEVEFWGHCSNLQVWAENGYNSKLLHMSLAFPLLKELVKVGDLQANRVLKEEIAQRYNNGIETVRTFLRSMDYLDYLSVEEFLSLLKSERERDVIDNLTSVYPRLKRNCRGVLTLMSNFDIRKERMSRINLGGLEMKEIPDCIRDLSSLEDLNISYNPIKKLPQWIGKFKKLVILKITNNGLKELPEEIGLLLNLEELNARGNQLKTLPKTLGSLISLKLLELYENNLVSIPDSIGHLVNLKKLIIYENRIKYLPDSIGNLKRLEELTIHKNLLSSLPDSIGNLEQLKEIYVGNNHIKCLPDSIGKLKNLEVLSITNNPIYKLPDSIYLLKKLRRLDLHNTYIEKYQLDEFSNKVRIVRN